MQRDQFKKSGYNLKLIDEETKSDRIIYTVNAFDKNGEKVGEYIFKQILASEDAGHFASGTLVAIDADTDEEHRRKGIATAAYCFIEEYTGKTLYSEDFGTSRTADGKCFWNQPDRPFGK